MEKHSEYWKEYFSAQWADKSIEAQSTGSAADISGIQYSAQRVKDLLKLEASDKIVEVGSSSGYFLNEVTKEINFIHSPTAIDYVQKLVDLGKTAYPHFNWICADAKHTSLPDHFANKVFIHNVIHHFEKIDTVKEVINELIRICSPGGCVLIGSVYHIDKVKKGTWAKAKKDGSNYLKFIVAKFFTEKMKYDIKKIVRAFGFRSIMPTPPHYYLSNKDVEQLKKISRIKSLEVLDRPKSERVDILLRIE